MVDDPVLVTRRQMNAWAGDFDNRAVCDHACWHLFERTPFAWEKARQWAGSQQVASTARSVLARAVGLDTAGGPLPAGERR